MHYSHPTYSLTRYSFREPELGIILRFETHPTTETKVYVKEVHGSHAESLGVMAGDEILAIAGTVIATNCPSQQDVLTLIQGTARPTPIRFRRDAVDSEGSRAPLTPATYKARAMAVMEVQKAEAEVKRIKQQLAEAVAVACGIQRSKIGVWRDRVQVEVHNAILHSFAKASVSLVDHHTASESFIDFHREEISKRGRCPADWVWLTPPAGGSMTKVFHQEMVGRMVVWASCRWMRFMFVFTCSHRI